jgi:thiamine biosynthesis lipoprotein ApbE
MNNYGMPSEAAADFVRWSQDPRNITIDNLVKLYALKDAPQRQQQAQAQTKAADMRTQQERLKVPRPTTVQTGQSAPTLTEEESFSNALLTNARR